MTAIGRYLLNPGTGEKLYQISGSRPSLQVSEAIRINQEGTSQSPLKRFEDQEKELRTLRGEINTWNLVNGLHLSREQAKTIYQCARAAQQVKQQDADRPVKRRQHRSSTHQSKQAKSRRLANLPPEAIKEIYQLENQVNTVLSDAQKEVIRDYKPCLVPPKNLKDPVRVGQANDNSMFSRLLERARNIPATRRQRAVDFILSREQKYLGQYSQQQLQQRRELMLKTIEEAAAMDDTEFQLHKEELADRLKQEDRKLALHQQLDDTLAARRLPGKTAQFLLLDEHVPGVLNKRIKQLSRETRLGRSKQNRMQNGPQAENYEGGSYGLPNRRYGKAKTE
jgi:hypothetical protein